MLEAVHGQQAEPLAPRRGRHTYNHAGVDDRVDVEQDVGGNRYPNEKDPGSPEVYRLGHAVFEVFSMDDVFRGHMHFRERAAQGAPYSLAWGVGRHVYGSQIYDYWHDPYGHVHEHMCDGDRVDASYGPNTIDMTDPGRMGHNGGNQWGPTVEESGVHNLNGPQCDSKLPTSPMRSARRCSRGT